MTEPQKRLPGPDPAQQNVIHVKPEDIDIIGSSARGTDLGPTRPVDYNKGVFDNVPPLPNDEIGFDTVVAVMKVIEDKRRFLLKSAEQYGHPQEKSAATELAVSDQGKPPVDPEQKMIGARMGALALAGVQDVMAYACEIRATPSPFSGKLVDPEVTFAQCAEDTRKDLKRVAESLRIPVEELVNMDGYKVLNDGRMVQVFLALQREIQNTLGDNTERRQLFLVRDKRISDGIYRGLMSCAAERASTFNLRPPFSELLPDAQRKSSLDSFFQHFGYGGGALKLEQDKLVDLLLLTGKFPLSETTELVQANYYLQGDYQYNNLPTVAAFVSKGGKTLNLR